MKNFSWWERAKPVEILKVDIEGNELELFEEMLAEVR